MRDETRHEGVSRLTRDQVQAARILGDKEARYAVDSYYLIQDDRKRAHNQVRSMQDEPHGLIAWLATNSELFEKQIKRALEGYAAEHTVGRWLMANHGIGPVIAAGLLAHINIEHAPTAGHIWAFAGLDPTKQWLPKTKRPWNADLKTLCWKAGQSFMKFSAAEECDYGQVYKQRKAYEIARNERGGNADTAAAILEAKKFNPETEAYKHLTAGHLPPAQIDARARRYAVKLMLSHLQVAWFFNKYSELPVKPYAMGQLDHTHFIRMPHTDVVPGLASALRAGRWQ